MIKSFRRSKRLTSLSSSPKNNISRVSSSSLETTPGSSRAAPLNADQILHSPKKVIRALYSYNAQGPGELGFKKGDFFHVLEYPEDENDPEAWYEATNPMTGVKGMVPVSYFEVFQRSRPSIVNETQVGEHSSEDQYHYPNSTSSTTKKTPLANSPVSLQFSNSSPSTSQSLYAITLYDFKAERSDELDVNVGENLIICAHHNYEWFIAKPINRLGGPGLVPVSFVKIIDMVKPSNVTPGSGSKLTDIDNDPIKLINTYNVPTVEQWKDQTAKYQASSIPLGMISSSQSSSHQGGQTRSLSQNSQYFRNGDTEPTLNRSSLSSTNTQIVEASVESYLLDKGRYQYLIVAKLNNGRTRYLTRYYQDFYDLQVKLLELFPFEAGKIENSKRIIPSIPGPLINVNDSISKLRREKLDYYLRNLVALPSNISRSEEVLALFDILDNGYDKELYDQSQNGKKESDKRSLKPVSQKSYYHHDRLSQYSNFHNNLMNGSGGNRTSSPNSTDLNGNLHRSLSSSSTNLLLNTGSVLDPQAQQLQQLQQQQPTKLKFKVKFYFEDDIFVLLLPVTLRLQDLKSKLSKRLMLENNVAEVVEKDLSKVRLYVKNEYDDFVRENEVEDTYPLNEIQKQKLDSFEIDTDEKFHEILHDKCKLTILV